MYISVIYCYNLSFSSRISGHIPDIKKRPDIWYNPNFYLTYRHLILKNFGWIWLYVIFTVCIFSCPIVDCLSFSFFTYLYIASLRWIVFSCFSLNTWQFPCLKIIFSWLMLLWNALYAFGHLILIFSLKH